jgi:hypothetical protein
MQHLTSQGALGQVLLAAEEIQSTQVRSYASALRRTFYATVLGHSAVMSWWPASRAPRDVL